MAPGRRSPWKRAVLLGLLWRFDGISADRTPPLQALGACRCDIKRGIKLKRAVAIVQLSMRFGLLHKNKFACSSYLLLSVVSKAHNEQRGSFIPRIPQSHECESDFLRGSLYPKLISDINFYSICTKNYSYILFFFSHRLHNNYGLNVRHNITFRSGN